MNAQHRWEPSEKTDRDLNAGLGRAGLNRQGRAQTPDDIDRDGQYLPPVLFSMTLIERGMVTIGLIVAFVGLVTLLWWVGRP